MSQIVVRHSPLPLVPYREKPAVATRVLAWLFARLERSRSRRQLGELDDRMLADIGVDRATARDEADSPFWRDSTQTRRPG